MKMCKSCNENIPSRVLIDGKQRNLQRRKYCLKCSPFGNHNTSDPKRERIYSKKYYKWQKKERKRRKEILVEKLGGKCKNCGYNKCIAALEFHHRDEKTKNFTISGNIIKQWELLLNEIEKCDLLCSNCHKELHWDES